MHFLSFFKTLVANHAPLHHADRITPTTRTGCKHHQPLCYTFEKRQHESLNYAHQSEIVTSIHDDVFSFRDNSMSDYETISASYVPVACNYIHALFMHTILSILESSLV
jgi:hypothetical protein